jgi:hypothetical protein
MRIGEVSMTTGFVEDYLTWHDQRKAEREESFRRSQLYWQRWTALAVTAAAAVAAIGWMVTAWPKK